MPPELPDGLPDGRELLERLRELPGGRELLELASDREDVELVGGAIRDMLLGHTPPELDVVVGDGAAVLARDLARELGTLAGQDDLGAQHERFGIREFERFGTFSVSLDVARIDIATRRSETYPAPGALPEVDVGGPDEDLERRDFTVNAFALTLGGQRRGSLRHPPAAPADLRQRHLRVLHDESFSDDPTRLLRMARYAARLGFTIEQHTARLADTAIEGGAIATLSGARIGAELRLALGEPDPVAALTELQRLGLLSAIHPRLRFDVPLAARALALLPADGRADLLLLAMLVLPLGLRAEGDRGAEARALLDRLQFPAVDRDRVVAAALAVPRLIDQLPAARSAGALHETLHGIPVEGIALAGALEAGQPALEAAARRWFEHVRHVQLKISGDDLIANGVPRGPEIGRLLHETLLLRLNDELPDSREAELAAALERR